MSKQQLLRAALTGAAVIVTLAGSLAADATWNLNTNGSWSTAANWSPASAPGSTNSTMSTDVATFGNATAAVRTVTVDSNRNIFGIVFSNNSYGYVVGGGVGSILLTDGGYIRAAGSGPAVTNTNNAAQFIIQGAAGSASFLNDSANSTLAFLGAVAGSATSGNLSTQHLGGSNNTITNVYDILLTDGTNGGKTALVVDGGIWSFSRNSSVVTNAYGTNFSGGLTVNAGYVTTAAAKNYGLGGITLGATSGSSNATLNLSLGLTNALLVRAGSSNNTLKLELTQASGSQTISSPLTLQHDLEVNIANTGANGSFTGAFAGSGTLTKTGSGTMTLGITPGGNTITYAVNGGLLTTGASTTALTDKNRLQIGSGGLVTMSGTGLTIAGFDGSGVFDYLTTSARSMRIGGTGTYNFSGTISNTSAFGLSMVMDLKEGGVQVFSGTSENKASTTARSGTLALDYTSNTSSKLSDTNILYLWYGNVDLRGGATTEVVASANLQYGQSTITRSSGSSVLNLGTNFAYNNGAHLNIGADNIAATTVTNANGILGGNAKYTVGGANFAKNDGAGNIVGLSAGDYTTLTANTNGSANVVYSVTDGLSGWSGTNTVSALGLKISTTQSGQTLNLGARPLSGVVLFTGANDYTISSTGTLSANSYLINYGTGTLTADMALAGTTYFQGAGITKLSKTSTAASGIVYVTGGTLEFSSNEQLGSGTGTGTVTIAGGKLLANTTGGSISLINSTNRTISLGGGDATIDVTGGNTLTINGIVKDIEGVGNPLTLGSSSTSGKIVLGGVNTFNGDVKLAGGTTSISADNNLGNANNWVEFTGNATLETTATIGTARYINLRSGKTGTFAPQVGTVLTVTNYIQGSGALTVDGSGTLELLSSANSYTGKTTISAGTLKLGAGASIAKSSEVNLGTTNAPGTLDLSANSSYAFGSSQTVSGYGAINIGAGKTVTIQGTLAPGNSAGIITNTGNLTLDSTATIVMELAGSGGVAGTDYDQLQVSGTLTLGGALTITNFGGFSLATEGSYTLYTAGTKSGNFASVNVAGDTLTWNSGSNAWIGVYGGSTTYTLTDGVLTAAAVPEPSTLAMLGLGGLALAAYRLRRRNR